MTALNSIDQYVIITVSDLQQLADVTAEKTAVKV